jgi:hypothetical protein
LVQDAVRKQADAEHQEARQDGHSEPSQGAIDQSAERRCQHLWHRSQPSCLQEAARRCYRAALAHFDWGAADVEDRTACFALRLVADFNVYLLRKSTKNCYLENRSNPQR